MGYEPLHHKYRPQTFTQLVGQDAIAETLSHALEQQRIAPAYLFCGPRGTGKTSSARILAKSLNCLTHAVPTPHPCGQCEVCRGISQGSILDIVEIDAASNTGVDNIRELIERAQFAPVQCRYKVYVIDECLTGDTLVQTQNGLMRIDDPKIEGQQVLSYHEQTGTWEFKQAVRWLDQGTRDILEIQTTHRKIRCTESHLIRTDQGWVAARDVKEGVKILSPAPVDAAPSSISSAPTGDVDISSEVINLKAIPTGTSLTVSKMSWLRQNLYALSVTVAAVRSWLSPSSCSKKEEVSSAFSPTGVDTLSRRGMETGSAGPSTSWLQQAPCLPNSLALFTGRSWETVRSPILTSTVDIPAWLGPMESPRPLGWSTKQGVSVYSVPSYKPSKTRVMANSPFTAAQPVTPIYKQPLLSCGQGKAVKPLQKDGSRKSLRKGGLGGTWTMAPSASALRVAPKSNSIQKGTRLQKTKSLPNGLQGWDIPQQQNPMLVPVKANDITMLPWALMQPETGLQICGSTPSPQWTTSLETVISVRPAGTEPVYDIEVADNHNFVANGLLVHNCHMLSTAAFNALLKTLEEPPEQVIFVLATTDPQRVLPTIISRCQRFDFRRIPLEAMVSHLQAIAQQETIDITEAAVRLVAQIAQGGLRDAESLLDQLSLLAPPVTAEKVWDLVGAVPERDLLALVQAIAADDGIATLEIARRLMDRGREPMIVLQNLAGFYRDLLIAKTAGERADLVAVTPPTWEAMQTFTQAVDLPLLLAGQKTLREAETQIRHTTQPRLWLEVTLMSLLPSAQASTGAISTPSTNAPMRSVVPPPPVPTPPPALPQTAPPATPAVPPAAPAAAPAPTATPVTPGATLPPAPAPETPAPPPPPPEEPTPTVAVTGDLMAIWAQVIGHVQPMGTRALMQQQGHLLSYDGQVARIGIKSKPLFKMAQGRVANIEAAFQGVFNQPVKVTLEVADAPPESPPPVSSSPGPPPPPVAPAASVNPAIAVPPSPTMAEAPAPPPVAEPPPPPAAAASEWQPTSDFDRAVKSFAEFFNGQIVDPEADEDETPANGKRKPKQDPPPDSSVPF